MSSDYDADMRELQYHQSGMKHDRGIKRKLSEPQLEQKLLLIDTSKLGVNDLRLLICELRDLDFADDPREKIPGKWSLRPDYLPDYVDFFDPRNGSKMENNKRGKKPIKCDLFPLFEAMRDHHFPNICSKKNAMIEMGQLNVRLRDDASTNAKAGMFANIDIPTDVQGGNGGCYSSDFKNSKPSDNFITQANAKMSVLPIPVEDQKSIEKFRNSKLIDITIESETPLMPSQNIDAAMEQVATTDAQATSQNTIFYNQNATSHDGVWSGNSYRPDLQTTIINNAASAPCPDSEEFQMNFDLNMLMDCEQIPNETLEDLQVKVPVDSNADPSMVTNKFEPDDNMPAENNAVSIQASDHNPILDIKDQNSVPDDIMWSGFDSDLCEVDINDQASYSSGRLDNNCYSSTDEGFQMDIDHSMLREMGCKLEEIPGMLNILNPRYVHI